MKRGKSYEWIPLWVEKWLWGSTRLELTPAERSVWVDLMALASKDDGYIRANPTTAYLDQQIAGMLCIDLELFQSTIEKCVQYEKLKKDKSGVLYIVNWEEYSLTGRHKRRLMSENPDANVRVAGHVSMSMSKSKSKSKDGNTKIIVDAWNTFAEKNGLTKIKGVIKGSKREGNLNARVSEKDFDFLKLLEIISRSPFLLGKAGKEPFFTTFDWIICPSNYQKIIEGNYLEKNGRQTSRTSGSESIAEFDARVAKQKEAARDRFGTP